MHLVRQKTIENELVHVKSEDPVIQATACELLSVLIESGETQLEYLLMQNKAYCVVEEVIERHPLLKLRFPVLKDYSAKFI